MNKKKAVIISICSVIAVISFILLGAVVIESDILDDLSEIVPSNKSETTKIVEKKENNFSSAKKQEKTTKFHLFSPKVNITKSKTGNIQYQVYNNGLFSMKIPKGWNVGVGKSDYIHYTFMAYDPKNPDYKIFFNMKTEGYLKTQQMKVFYNRYYPTSPFAKLPVINPQTTEAFYKVYTTAFALNQNILPFKVPTIKGFKTVQSLGKNPTGGSIVRATYQNESGKNVEGIFTATIKEFAMPPVTLLIVYNTVFFTAPEGELVEWLPILNYSLSSIKFSDSFISGYYREQGQVMRNASAIQAICNQTSDIITSGWTQRQKTYDILSQKRSDAAMGYERVRDTDTGEIYKATVGFSDHDWHGKYEPITDDMYNLPTAGYIEKQ